MTEFSLAVMIGILLSMAVRDIFKLIELRKFRRQFKDKQEILREVSRYENK